MPGRNALPTLRDDARDEWLRGCLFRAYVLQKDRADVRPAVQLLEQIRRQLPHVTPDDTNLMSAQAQRLHARTLIRSRDPVGRALILELFRCLGGRESFRGAHGGERARLLTDLSLDLSLIGAHPEAIAAAGDLASDATDAVTRAHRLGNLASASLQHAVALRAADEADGALERLDQTSAAAEEALGIWADRPNVAEHSLALREVEAIALSAQVVRSWLAPVDLEPVVKRLHALLRACLRPPRDETYLQVLYRIGRLGDAHLRMGVGDPANGADHISRARAYLEMAWRTSGNACIRPWLAAELLAALEADDDLPAARAFAREATARLKPQCGPAYPVVEQLARAVGEESQ